MIIKSDDKLRLERSKLKDLELKNISLKNSFEELKTTHENLKTSHETLNISWETLKDKHEKLKEAHNSLLAREVKGKMSMGVECNILNTSPCSSNPSCSTRTSS
jgi:phage shock protein A